MKTCLVVIYNHKFERNIRPLSRLYAKRFSSVVHVMPFYRGTDPNVISVYENSYQFSGYVAQASSQLRKIDCDDYFFISDDMMLNPRLSEDNLREVLTLKPEESFISMCELVDDNVISWWPWALPSMMNFLGSANSCQWHDDLPKIEEARVLFEKAGFNLEDAVSHRLFSILRSGCRVYRQTPFQYAKLPFFKYFHKYYRFFASRDKVYPFAYGYSDCFLVSRSDLDTFSHYAGVFAAARVFVEMAIPTSMVLSGMHIKTLKDIPELKAENGVDDASVREKIELNSNFDYLHLLGQFPRDYLYIHPVKISKWRNLP